MRKISYLQVALFAGLPFVTSIAFASAFQINEQSAALIGTAMAGSAVTDNASMVYFNPAEMVFAKHPEFSASFVAIIPKVSFNPELATNAALSDNYDSLPAIPLQPQDLGNDILAGSDLSSPQRNALVPGFYYVYPINSQLAVGLASTAPFGLKTVYGDDSPARYFATHSSITTMDITPDIAIKPSPHFSTGFGLDFIYAKAELDQAVDAQNLFYLYDPTTGIIPMFNGDLLVKNRAHNWGIGWHAGIYWEATSSTDIGLAYHSKVRLNLKGTSNLEETENAIYGISSLAIPAGLVGLTDRDVTAPLTLPDYLTFSVKQYIKPTWDVLADIAYTRWSSIPAITLNFSNNQSSSEITDYKDVWRVSLGQEFQLTPKFKWRMGVAYDESPIRSEYRSARLPDADRYWVSTGLNYKINPRWDMDVGYSHIFFKHSTLLQYTDNRPLGGIQALMANYTAHADLLGAQINYHFA